MSWIQFNFKIAIRITKVLLLILISLTLISTIWIIVNVIFDWDYPNNDKQSDQQRTLLIMSIVMLVLILICLFGYIGALKQSFWITVIFAVGLTILWISIFSIWTMFTYFFISCHIFIIGTIISAGFFAKFLHKQNQVTESNEINSNSHISSESSTTTSTITRQWNEGQTNGQMFFISIHQDSIPGCSYFVSEEPPPTYNDIFHDQSDTQLNFQHQEFISPIKADEVLDESIQNVNSQS